MKNLNREKAKEILKDSIGDDVIYVFTDIEILEEDIINAMIKFAEGEIKRLEDTIYSMR